MQIWISNEQSIPWTEPLAEILQRVAQRTFELAGSHIGTAAELSVALVDNQEMQVLNRYHRGIDQPTDVLSFSQLEGEELSALPAGEPILLGDIVLSLERCAEQATDYGHSFERELGFLIAHGVLHLLGYDHQSAEEEAVMMAKTEEVLGGLGLVR